MWYSRKITNKLFFKKYVYKVAIRTPLANIFRGNRLGAVKGNLLIVEDSLSRTRNERVSVGGSWSRSLASKDDALTGWKIVEILEDLKDYSLRVESQTLGIYFNDSSFLDKLTETAGIYVEELSEPFDDKSKEFLLTHPGVIFRKEYTHKYKVTLRYLGDDASNFKEWASKYEKIKIIPSNKYSYGGHFYVADDKMLSLCRLYLCDKIAKIEELVTVSEM